MIVAQFMPTTLTGHKEKKAPRDRTEYRAARRNIAKINYRRAKRAAQNEKNKVYS